MGVQKTDSYSIQAYVDHEEATPLKHEYEKGAVILHPSALSPN